MGKRLLYLQIGTGNRPRKYGQDWEDFQKRTGMGNAGHSPDL